MTDEVMQEQAAIPEEVATAETETPAVEVEEVKEAEKESKTFSQEELDRIIQKEKAKAEARAERRALKVYADKLEAMNQPVQQQPVRSDDGKPNMAKYDNVEDYVEAVAEWKLQQREQVARSQQVELSQRQIYDKAEKIYQEAEKVSGFDRETFNALPIPDAVAHAILDSDIAPALVVHLANNPDEAERIARLSPARQAAEIGKLELKVSATKPKTSNAPAPIRPIGSKGSGSSNGDMTRMSMDEFLAARAKQGARWSR